MSNPTEKPLKPAVILGTMTFGYRENPRINDPEVVQQILDIFRGFGHDELDTARGYCDGSTEELLGDLEVVTKQNFKIATKVTPQIKKSGKSPIEIIEDLSQSSLAALKVPKVDLLYLHAPDHTTPIEITLKGVQQVYEKGLFKELGLSNFTAWQVAEVYYICKHNGYVLPTVYQGMVRCISLYAITRDVEHELFSALRKFGIRFYAYNPLAGGLFAGKFTSLDSEVEKGSRFDPNLEFGRMYRERYGREAYFEAINSLSSVVAKHNISTVEAGLRWINHHGKLDANRGDAIIIGASSVKHARENLEFLEKGPLPDDIVQAFDETWHKVKPFVPPYFR
ncbi:8581_t:CDS:10 [Ambispora leptoticha]|uniref:8581_t:CDS:1 n=1 Tax=Ambispora leptoticha TaxID=144679 RepID=A0A9N9A3Q4_9GLOM|nr:8581_t:CDS:10 [Ambispora leptoticha]